MNKLNIEFLINSEKEFLLNLYDNLKDNYNIKKSVNKYCNIDFILNNKTTKNIFYIELKERNIKYINYSSFIIGYVKIKNILKYYKKCLLVWKFNNIYFYGICKEEYKKYKQSLINGGLVVNINKVDLNRGTLEDLIKYIRLNF